MMATLKQKLPLYLSLIRFDRPIGTYLLLWPTLWALWIASEGSPDINLLVIFTAGTFLMRSAGCAINDFADRHFDGQVERTAQRPLARGVISPREAVVVAIVLSLLAFVLVLFTNQKTIWLSLGAILLAACYPFMKRHTHLPQVVLGAAFAWGIPMAFAAQTDSLPPGLWLIYIATVLWTVVYDTFYAMVDREDDLRAGIKSTAILFGNDDKLITRLLQVCTLVIWLLVGNQFTLGYWYHIGVAVAAALFIYQQWLIRDRDRQACFRAFLNNNWVGASLFAGIVADFLNR